MVMGLSLAMVSPESDALPKMSVGYHRVRLNRNVTLAPLCVTLTSSSVTVLVMRSLFHVTLMVLPMCSLPTVSYTHLTLPTIYSV